MSSAAAAGVNGVDLLSRRLAGLRVRRPGFAVCLWGEPGIGKTHTALRLLRETPCRHLSVHATLPPTALAQALPRPSKLPVWAERTLERAQNGEALEATQLTDTLGAVLGGLAPFIVQLEDLHEAGTEQVEFVQALAQTVVRLRGVGLVVTSREPPPEGVEALRLAPLSDEETQALLEGEVGAISAGTPCEPSDPNARNRRRSRKPLAICELSEKHFWRVGLSTREHRNPTKGSGAWHRPEHSQTDALHLGA